MPEAGPAAGLVQAFSLAGRAAIVTGASRGLGLAIARALGAARASVALNGRCPKTLRGACRTLAAQPLPFDVADGEAGAAASACQGTAPARRQEAIG